MKRVHDLGFTLLEVMVAVAILGLGLTAILSGQVNAFAASANARDYSEAVGLARCKMLEIEEDTLREGFQELDIESGGPCCDNVDHPRMTCTWALQKPTLPEATSAELDLDTGLDLGGGDSGGGSSPLSLLANGGGLSGNGSSDVASGLAALGGLAGGDDEEGGGGGIAGLFGTMYQMVYPQLRPMFEASTRRAVVTVKWKRGSVQREMTLEQWLVIPQQGVDELAADAMGDQLDTLLNGAQGGGPAPGGANPPASPVRP